MNHPQLPCRAQWMMFVSYLSLYLPRRLFCLLLILFRKDGCAVLVTISSRPHCASGESRQKVMRVSICPTRGLWRCLFDFREILDPMFLFQFLLVCNSFYWRSYLASSIWACLAVYGILNKVLVARTSQRKVQGLVEQSDRAPVSVLRTDDVDSNTEDAAGDDEACEGDTSMGSRSRPALASSGSYRRKLRVVQARDLVPGKQPTVS